MLASDKVVCCFSEVSVPVDLKAKMIGAAINAIAIAKERKRFLFHK